MKTTLYNTIYDQTIRFLDHSTTKNIFSVPTDALTSFAIDDAIAQTVGEEQAPATVRIWVHDPTLVLGIPDSRLPYIEQGVRFAQHQQKHVVIRNSGGLAVLLDRNVLNVSLFFPNKGHLSIHDGYHIMFHFVQELFSNFTTEIEAYEIVGSYCPGDYDLSIGGIKFAGISQRRVRNGVAIQIYIDVRGSSYKRASFVRDFYHISKQDEQTKHLYPEINPSTMGSISDLLSHSFTIQQIIEEIKQLFQKTYRLSADKLTSRENTLFQSRLKQMKKRNEKIAPFLD